MINLLPDDLKLLDNLKLNYQLHEIGNETFVVIKDYALSSMFEQTKTDVLFKVPRGYPMAPLDMFWVNPVIRLKGTSSYPGCADVFEALLPGQSWQRFSRHYPWKTTYTLQTHLNVIREVLVGGRG